MKKIIVFTLCALLIITLLGGCDLFGGTEPTPTPTRTQPAKPVGTAKPTLTPIPTERDLLIARAREIVDVLQKMDVVKLSTYVHPIAGIRFTPYVTVSMTDRVFKVPDLKAAFYDNKKYTWGLSPITGQQINLTFREYLGRYVYNVDFKNAQQIGFNQTLGKGRYYDNSREFYKDANIIEFHTPFFEARHNGADWQSLRLVFQKEGTVWYLVGAIHAQGIG